MPENSRQAASVDQGADTKDLSYRNHEESTSEKVCLCAVDQGHGEGADLDQFSINLS